MFQKRARNWGTLIINEKMIMIDNEKYYDKYRFHDDIDE